MLLGVGIIVVIIVVVSAGKKGKTWESTSEASETSESSGTLESLETSEVSGVSGMEAENDTLTKEESEETSEAVREVEQIGLGQVVALTFDDGPSEYTGKLLDILKQKEVPATFFVLGKNANIYPDLVKREATEGHEVESHTMSHQNLAVLNEVDVRAEISGAEQTICAILNKINCIKYLRPPYGEISGTVRNVVGKPMIGWSIDTLDWQSKDPQMIQDRTLGVIRGGAIILLHDIYETSVEGAERIINELKAAGFTFVTVDGMAKKYGANLATGEYYRSFD